MFRHFWQEEWQTDGDSIEPVLTRAFPHQGARNFDDDFWLHLIHDGSTKKRLEYCQDEDGNLCYFRAIQGHSAGVPISPNLMNSTPIPNNWKEYIYHKKFVGFSVHSGEWNNSGRKREGQGSPSSLSNTTESFWKRPGKGEASFRLHSSSKSSSWNSLETQPKCCVLGTIEDSAWTQIGKPAQNREKQDWKNGKPELDNAWRLRGIYFIDPDDEEHTEILKNARRKLERPVAPAMPCERQTSIAKKRMRCRKFAIKRSFKQCLIG